MSMWSEGPLVLVGRNVNCYNPYGKENGAFFRKIKIGLPYGPTITLVGIYPKEMETLFRSLTCTSLFTATSSTIAKARKQPKCP